MLRVLDGDTLQLHIDLGLETYRKIIVRLAGLDCPEHNTPDGTLATAFTTDWVASEGPTFLVRTTKDRTEKYGRYLAEVWGSESCLNQKLLSTGHAKPYSGGKKS